MQPTGSALSYAPPLMARDSEATRRRIFEAAFEEFARHGIAGARIDRIAAAACANKQLIYAYFGSKQALFDEFADRGADCEA